MAESPASKRWGHVSVMAQEVVNAFAFQRPAIIVDGTLGAGGHSERLLETYPDIRIIGLEWDRDALTAATQRLERFGNRFKGFEWSYAELPTLMSQQGIAPVDGIVLDLGLSSRQLDDTGRGFSFLRPGPLDMRMSRALSRTAWDLITQLSVEELTDLFRRYGEEPQGRRIAQQLKEALSNGTLKNDAWEVAEFIRRTTHAHHGRIDPSTRCFQALRIAVNHELDNIQQILAHLESILVVGGRAAIISFHSLEDRLVKRSFQQAAKGCICPPQIPQCMCGRTPWAGLIKRQALQASEQEIAENPRARSARLRLLEKL